MTDTNDNFGDLDRHASFLRRIAWKSVRGEDLDDLVQDCLLVELEHGPQDERRTFAWLRTIMRNRVAEDYRRRARRSLREKASAKSELTSSAFEVVEHRAALKAVTNAVTGLPPELYDVIRLRYFDGLKIKEIALKRKLPQRTVKYRLELALGQLRRKLENKGNGRGALATLAGFANDRAWNIGAWLAVKKMTLGVVIAVLAIGTLSWVVWTDASLGVDVLDEPASQVIARDAQIARRADTVLEDSDGEAKPEVTALAIDRQRDIFGRVVTQLNEPIEGAAVESRSHPWQRLSVLSPRASEYVVGGRTQSGIDGSFALRHQRGDVVEIRVSKPGFASLSLTRRVAGEKLKIVLHPAGALRIEVLAEGGCPIHEARVTIWREATKGSGGSQYDRRHYTSDARGEILIEDLAPGRIKFHVRHRAYLGSPFKDTQIDAGTRRDLTVTLGAAGVIRGRVTDAQTGAALAGAKVSIQSGGDPAITDADGYYERPGCSTAKGSQILIEVSAKGFASDQKLASFGQRTYDFALNRGDAVVGRCLDLEGRAIGGVRVSLVASARSVNGQVTDMASALSQSDGSFRIEDLRRSLPHTLIFDSPGYGRKHLDFDPFPGDRPGVIDLGDVALAAGLKIAGRIIRDDGTLVANTRVTLKGTNADRFKYRGVGAGVAVRYYGESEQRRSDDLGRFCFPDLSTGEFTLEVSLRGSVLSKIAVNLSTEDREDIEFVAVPGEVMTLKATGGHGSKFRDLRPLEIAADLEFQAIILDATTPISGRVVDVAGKSLAGVEVGAQLANGELRQVFSGHDGLFSMDLPTGQIVDLVLSGRRKKRAAGLRFGFDEGRYRGRLDGVTVPSSGLTIRAEELANNLELTVHVVDTAGHSVAGANVYAFAGENSGPLKSDRRGRVVFRKLRSTLLRVVATPSAEDGGRHYSSIGKKVLPANQEITVVLRDARTLKGRVILEGGEPAVKFVVEAYVGSDEHYRIHTDQNGAFELTLVEGLLYTLKAYSPDRSLKGQLEGVDQGPVIIKALK